MYACGDQGRVAVVCSPAEWQKLKPRSVSLIVLAGLFHTCGKAMQKTKRLAVASPLTFPVADCYFPVQLSSQPMSLANGGLRKCPAFYLAPSAASFMAHYPPPQ